jgi:hypothetical protein
MANNSVLIISVFVMNDLYERETERAYNTCDFTEQKY